MSITLDQFCKDLCPYSVTRAHSRTNWLDRGRNSCITKRSTMWLIGSKIRKGGRLTWCPLSTDTTFQPAPASWRIFSLFDLLSKNVVVADDATLLPSNLISLSHPLPGSISVPHYQARQSSFNALASCRLQLQLPLVVVEQWSIHAPTNM